MLTFGPIPSRRLGLSLGINNIKGEKVCSYSCVYCQVGAKCKMRNSRSEYYSTQEVIDSVSQHLNSLAADKKPDVLAFVPNGEPTLDIHLGEHIKALQQFHIPVVVITNGTLLNDPQVREDLMDASWVSVKVDAGSEEIWHKHNRPVKTLAFEKYLEGIKKFALQYEGTLVTETMMCDGFNDSTDNIKAVAAIIQELKPDISYITIPTRPPALKGVTAPSHEALLNAYEIFSNNGLKAELVTGFEGDGVGETGDVKQDILHITAVHPLRKDTIMKMMADAGMEFSVVDEMVASGLLTVLPFDGLDYYLRKG